MLALGVAACGDDEGIGPGAVIEVEAPATRLTEGESLQLRVRAGGQDVRAGVVRWESRDPSTLTVDANGIVRGIAPGVTWAVASGGGARDSVELTVRFRGLAAGMAVRVAGAGNVPIRLGGTALLVRGAFSGAEYTTIWADNRVVDPTATSREVFAIGDSVLNIWLPKRLEVGVTSVGAPVVEMTSHLSIRPDTNGNGIFFSVHDDAKRRQQLFIAVSPARLEVTSMELPPAPGNRPGRLTGAVSFEAASLQIEFNADGSQTVTPLADTTVTVYAEFTTPIFHVLRGGGTVSVSGPQRYAGEYTVAMQGIVAGGGGVTVRVGPRLLNFGQIGKEFVFSHYLWLPHPEVTGPVTIGQLLPPQRNDSVGGPTAWARSKLGLFTRIDPRFPGGSSTPEDALSRAGSVTIVRYQPPTQTDYGIIELSGFTVDYDLVRNEGYTGETLRIARPISVTIPVDPLGGAKFPGS